MNIDASLYSFDRVRAFNDAEIKKQLQYMFIEEDIDTFIQFLRKIKDFGKQTADMAVRCIGGEAASEIPVETQKECALVVNKAFAESVGVEVPAEVLENAVTVY